MTDKPLPMGKVYKGHYGTFTFPTEILEVGIFDDRIEILCEDGVWVLRRDEATGKVSAEHNLKDVK